MPRTKVSKNAHTKRNRRNSTDDKKEELLRELDIEAENMMATQQISLNEHLRSFARSVAEIKASIPAHILNMKMSDLRSMDIQHNVDELWDELSKAQLERTMEILDSTVASKMIRQKNDEGYITEETISVTHSRGTNSMEDNGVPADNIHSINKNVQLLSLKKTRVRRSASTGASSSTISAPTNFTPGGPRAWMSSSKAKTPLAPSNRNLDNAKADNTRSSRSKYRTPLVKMRPKAASADRIGMITPKVQPNTPIAILRHARAGEFAFSASGSPIVTAGSSDCIANVNFPILDGGVLSIRPTEMRSVDPSIIRKLDAETWMDLKQLSHNLNMIMEARFGQKRN